MGILVKVIDGEKVYAKYACPDDKLTGVITALRIIACRGNNGKCEIDYLLGLIDVTDNKERIKSILRDIKADLIQAESLLADYKKER